MSEDLGTAGQMPSRQVLDLRESPGPLPGVEAHHYTRWWLGPDAPRGNLPSPVRLLLVEDDPGDAALVYGSVGEAAGAECVITTVVRLSDAQEHLDNEIYDCVLLDLSLPDSAGMDTIRSIVSVSPELPVVILTGSEDERTARAAVHAGAQDFLNKRYVDGQLLWRVVQYAIERKSAEVTARHHALHDALTGLANRTLFLDQVQMALGNLGRVPGHVAVLFIDLDRFKWVNDSLGHAAGDALLIAVANRLQAELRPFDLAARLGGDEFLVLCQGIQTEYAALEFAERIQRALSQPFAINDTEVWTSVSVGIALRASPVATPEEVIQEADVAMYRAKDLGKGRCQLFDVGMQTRVVGRQQLTNEIHRGLAAEEFKVFYQPVVDLDTGSVVGAEALVRWQHPDSGLLLPREFIGHAEETGLVVPIGEHVLRVVCRQLAAWQAEGKTLPMVSVNVSARQLEDPTFVSRLRDAIDSSGVDPRELALEITETALLGDSQTSLLRLREITALGVLLCIDDFGTGYSSLTYLKKFPFDIVKIDTSFTEGLGADETDTAIVQAVVMLATSLRLNVVAEGVETAMQAERLHAMGCGFAQGYHFGHPGPSTDLKISRGARKAHEKLAR